MAPVSPHRSRWDHGRELKARITTDFGFAGPLIYQLANGAPTLTRPCFNDVTLGSNGYGIALPGWHYTSGLGSWDIYVVNKQIPSTYPQ